MGTPVVTVVMPVYNSLPYLHDTIASLVNQTLTHHHLEIIAINDGSTDGSAEVLDQAAVVHSHFRVIHQANSGWPGQPRNRGLGQATGKYVFFMDSDDIVVPDALEQLVTMAEAESAEVVIPRMTGTGGRNVQSFFSTRKAGVLPLELALHTLSPQKLFFRAFLERHNLRFTEGMVRLEDGIFVTHAYLNATRILLCGDTPLYFISQRDDGENISSRDIEPAGYVNSISAMCVDIRGHVSQKKRANRLVLELFQRKGLNVYRPDRWLMLASTIRERWVSEHQRFVQREVPPTVAKLLKQPGDRQLMRLIREANIAGIDEHVLARAANTHRSHVSVINNRGRLLELAVEIQPAPENELLTEVGLADDVHMRAVEFDGGCLPTYLSGRRLRMAATISNLTAPFSGSTVLRAITRRLENVIAGDAPRMRLVIVARKSGAQHTLPARWAGAARYRFVIPPEFIVAENAQSFDIYTMPRTAHGWFGRLSRVSVGDNVAHRGWGKAKTYRTDQGNLSIHG